MSEERKKVLEMLAEGKITSAEAERLLERLEPHAGEARSVHAERSRPDKSGVPKYLRVVVDST